LFEYEEIIIQLERLSRLKLRNYVETHSIV
jgi:hypothetical protein